MDWPKQRSSTAHCRNCIATSGRREAPRIVISLIVSITEHWLEPFQARGQSSRFSWSFVHTMPLAARSAARNCIAR